MAEPPQEPAPPPSSSSSHLPAAVPPPPPIPRLLTAPDLEAAGAWDTVAAEARAALAFLLGEPGQQQQQPPPPPPLPPALCSVEGLAAALGFAKRLWALQGDPWGKKAMDAAAAPASASPSVYEACLQGVHTFLPLLAECLPLAPFPSVTAAAAAAASSPPVVVATTAAAAAGEGAGGEGGTSALAAIACSGLLAMDEHVRGDYRRLTGLWKALVQLAVTHKDALLSSFSSASFIVTAALTRLLGYAEQGLEKLEKTGAALRQQQAQPQPQQQQQQQQAAAGRAFEQAGKLLAFFLLRIALLGAHFGPSTLTPLSEAAGPSPSPIMRRLAALLIRLRGLMDTGQGLWTPGGGNYSAGLLKMREAVAGKTESAFHKILLGPVGGAASSSSSRPTTPEEAAAAAAASATAGAAAAPASTAGTLLGAAEEDEQAAAVHAHVRVGAALLAAVAVVACQGGGQEEGRIALGARALLVHTLKKAEDAAAAADAGAGVLSRVLFGGESTMGLAHAHAGIAAATAALPPPSSSSAHAEGGEGEEEDEVVAGLLAGAAAKGVLAAGDLGAARPHLFHPALLSPNPRARRLSSRLWRRFLSPSTCHPTLQQHLLETLLDVVAATATGGGGGGGGGLTLPERVHLASAAAEGMGAVGSWDVKCTLLKRLVESATTAVRATALSNNNGQQQQGQKGEPLAVAVALATALRLTAGAFRTDVQESDYPRAKALRKFLRPLLLLCGELQQQQPHQQQRRRPQWGGVGLGWVLLTWDAAVPGVALPSQAWQGLMDHAVRSVYVGEETQEGEEGQEGQEEALRAALGSVVVAAGMAMSQLRLLQQQGQQQQQQPARRWVETLAQAAAAVGSLLRQPLRGAVLLAALPALVALTEVALGFRWMLSPEMAGDVAGGWAAFGGGGQEEEPCTVAVAAAAAAAARVIDKDGMAECLRDSPELAPALRAVAARLLASQQQQQQQQHGGYPPANDEAAASFLLLKGHDVLALPPIRVVRRAADEKEKEGAAGMGMEVVTVDDDDDHHHEEEASALNNGGNIVTVALDGRRAVLLPTAGPHEPPALLLLPAGSVGSVRSVVEGVLEQGAGGAWQVGMVQEWGGQGQQQQGVVHVRMALTTEEEAAGRPE